MLYKSNKQINKSFVFFIVRITTNFESFIFIASEQYKQSSKINLSFALRIIYLCCPLEQELHSNSIKSDKL